MNTNTISYRLIDLRYREGYTQEELAQKANISKSCIAMIETGKNEPKASTIIKLANIFKVSADYLLCLEDEYSLHAIKDRMTKDESYILSMFRSLEEHDKYRLIGYAQALNNI